MNARKPKISIFLLPRQLGLALQIDREVKFANRTMYVPLYSDGLRPQDVAHEVGHFLVAPKGRRYKKDYGIPRKQERPNHWELDETKALLVEHYLLERFGLPFKKDPLRLVSLKFKSERNKARKWWREEGKMSVITQLAGVW